jgi:hypothetical protein
VTEQFVKIYSQKPRSSLLGGRSILLDSPPEDSVREKDIRTYRQTIPPEDVSTQLALDVGVRGSVGDPGDRHFGSGGVSVTS